MIDADLHGIGADVETERWGWDERSAPSALLRQSVESRLPGIRASLQLLLPDPARRSVDKLR